MTFSDDDVTETIGAGAATAHYTKSQTEFQAWVEARNAVTDGVFERVLSSQKIGLVMTLERFWVGSVIHDLQ